MQNPTPPRLPSRLLAILLFCLPWALASADEPSPGGDAKASCSGQYQPEFKQRWDLEKADWDELCRGLGQPGGRIIPKKTPNQTDPAISVQAGAADAQRALDTQNFNGLYDKYAGGGADGASPVQAPPSTNPAALKPAGNAATTVIDQAPVPAGETRIDPKDVAAHFKYVAPDSALSDLPGPLGWLGRLADKHIVKPIRGAFFSGKEKAYVNSMTDELQQSEEGRKIMRGIISEGIVVEIEPTDFPGSPVVKNGDLEEIQGTRGMAVPDEKTYHFNANFMKMQDKEVALESVSSNMGHELNHILLHERVDKTFKGDYHDVLNYALVDEQSARLKGYVVAYELNKGKPNGYVQEARGMLNNPDAYWESMKLWMPAYARALDLDEMKDPVRSYQARLQALTDKLDEVNQEGPDLDFDLRRIDHMGQAHGLAAQLTELRSLFQSDKDTMPTRTQDVKDSIDLVKERIKYLQSAEGKPFADKIKSAATDPKFTKLFGDMQGDLEKLEGLQVARPIPSPKATPGQMGWKAFEKRWNELHVDAPGQDPPWKEKP